MPLIADTLTDITGELTEYASIMVRSEIRAGSTSLITPETEEIPVLEGKVSFHAEPGAGMLILRREKNQYSRQEIIPIWVPEYDTTLREVIQLGKTHTNTDGDTANDLVEQLLSTITGAVADGLTQIEDATAGLIIGDDGVSVDLTEYATIVYVDEQIEQIELTQGQDGPPGASAYEVWIAAGNTGTEEDFLSSLKGEDGQDGDDGDDGPPGASAYEVWIAAGNTGTEEDFLSSLKGEDGQDGDDGDDGPPGASTYEVWIAAGNTGTEEDFLSSLKGEDGQEGQDGLSPHIDQVTGNWVVGDYDTGVKAQGPKGDPGDGGGTSAVLKTTMGFPQETEGVEPGEIWIETFSGLTFRAKGSFGMIPADMSAVYPVGQDPTGMPGLEQLPAGTILTDDGTNFWQLSTFGEVRMVSNGNSNYAQMLYGYGTMRPGTAFKIDIDEPNYPAGLYLISDVPPVTGWEQFTLSPDAYLTYMVNNQNTVIQGLATRIAALENPESE